MKEEFESARKWVEEHEVCRFEGDLNDEENIKIFVTHFIELTEANIQNEKVKRKLFIPFIELIHTFQAYIPETVQSHDYSGVMKIGLDSTECRIKIDNLGRCEVIEEMIGKIEEINPYANNPEQQKKFYADTIICNAQKVQKSFGFIDIMRKSNHKILYNIESIDNEYSYFSVIATVKVFE